MKSREWVSPRTTAITGILIVLLLIGFYFYMRHDTQNYIASLPKVPTRQSADSLLVPISFTEEAIAQPEAVPTEEPLPSEAVKQETVSSAEEAAACAAGGCNHAGSHHSSKDSGDAGIAGAEHDDKPTEEELNQLLAEICTFPPPDNLDELLDQYENYAIALLGPSPKIPQLMSLTRTGFTLINLSEKARTTGYNEQDVDNLLDNLPVVVLSDMTEIAIDLFNPSEEYIAIARENLRKVTENIDMLELLKETRPLIQEGIDAGDISLQEGEAFMQSLTGKNVTMHEADRTSDAAEDGASRSTSPEMINLDVSEPTETPSFETPSFE